MYFSTGAGAAYTAGAGTMYFSTGAGAAYTAGSGAMCFSTGAGATYTAGEGAMYATKGAGAAYTAEAVATYSTTGAKQQTTPLERARRIYDRLWGNIRPRWYRRDVLNDGHSCGIRNRSDVLDNESMCGVHCGCRQCRNTGAGATEDTTGAGASYRNTGAGATQDTTGAGASNQRQALVQQKTPLEQARRIDDRRWCNTRPRWCWRDVLNDGRWCNRRHHWSRRVVSQHRRWCNTRHHGSWRVESTTGAGATEDTTGAGASYRRQALVQHKTPLVLARRTQRWALMQHNTQGILERAGAANVTVATRTAELAERNSRFCRNGKHVSSRCKLPHRENTAWIAT